MPTFATKPEFIDRQEAVRMVAEIETLIDSNPAFQHWQASMAQTTGGVTAIEMNYSPPASAGTAVNSQQPLPNALGDQIKSVFAAHNVELSFFKVRPSREGGFSK